MSEQQTMPSTHELGDESFMSVADIKAYVAQLESAKASASLAATERAAQAKKDLIKKLKQPIDLTPERIHAFMSRVRQAAESGDTEILVARFPSELLTDHGRAINNAEMEWPDTLVGVPRQLYEVWKEKLSHLGYHLNAMIIDWPDGFPGDVGMHITWK